MSLKYAILGLLSVKPLTGYEIKSSFNDTIRFLWNSDQTQIYRVLAEINGEGLASLHTVQQNGRPNRKVYKITESGLDDLKIWLSSPLPPKPTRNAELLQIFFSGEISDEQVLVNLKRIRGDMQTALEKLALLEDNPVFFNDNTVNARNLFFFNAIRELGIRNARMNIEWLDEVIMRIETSDTDWKGKKKNEKNRE